MWEIRYGRLCIISQQQKNQLDDLVFLFASFNYIVTNELVEFKKWPVEDQDFMQISSKILNITGQFF